MKKDIEKEIARLMSINPDYTYEEAKELVEFDLEVDKMPMSEVLTKEEKQFIKTLTKAEKDPTSKPKEKKVVTRKENPSKRYLVDILANALKEEGIENSITNVEKSVEFEFEGVAYTVNLVAHRPKKNSNS